MTELPSPVRGGANTTIERLLKGVALLGGFFLLLIMLLVSTSVFFRYVLNQPILGDQELVEIGISLVVMAAMPYTALKGEHIRVDIFDQRLGPQGRFLADVFARLLSCFVLFLLVSKTRNKTLDAHEYGDVTNMIEIPVSLAYGAISIGMGLFALVLLFQLAQQFRLGAANYE